MCCSVVITMVTLLYMLKPGRDLEKDSRDAQEHLHYPRQKLAGYIGNVTTNFKAAKREFVNRVHSIPSAHTKGNKKIIHGQAYKLTPFGLKVEKNRSATKNTYYSKATAMKNGKVVNIKVETLNTIPPTLIKRKKMFLHEGEPKHGINVFHKDIKGVEARKAQPFSHIVKQEIRPGLLPIQQESIESKGYQRTKMLPTLPSVFRSGNRRIYKLKKMPRIFPYSFSNGRRLINGKSLQSKPVLVGGENKSLYRTNQNIMQAITFSTTAEDRGSMNANIPQSISTGGELKKLKFKSNVVEVNAKFTEFSSAYGRVEETKTAAIFPEPGSSSYTRKQCQVNYDQIGKAFMLLCDQRFE